MKINYEVNYAKDKRANVAYRQNYWFLPISKEKLALNRILSNHPK
jgi:hypothetical protein